MRKKTETEEHVKFSDLGLWGKACNQENKYLVKSDPRTEFFLNKAAHKKFFEHNWLPEKWLFRIRHKKCTCFTIIHTIGSALSTTISQIFPSWPASNSDSKSRVALVAFGIAETLSGMEFSKILDCKVGLWLGLRTYTCKQQIKSDEWERQSKGKKKAKMGKMLK